MTLTDASVLITGASSGLGAEFATQFARRGHDLVLVARRAERLQELSDCLRREYGVCAYPIGADLAVDGAARALRQQVREREVRIGGLVNNAGFGLKGALVEADPARLDEMVRLNVGAVVAMTREFLPDILAADGLLVNVASTAAFQPCPTMAAYGASKSFVLNFTEAVAHEVRGTGARVLAISPGATRTEFFDVVGDASAAVGRFQSSAQVVSRTFRALESGSRPPSVVSGWSNAATAALTRLLPRRALLAISGRVLT
ncbi:SDR family oxidoreductase [Ruania alkalisoli]|uniref:SDR family oxidoreductase n=1 Tax=Ruania alkalisoli TaxID=2779775 RepID=A0A7M1SVG2_9MICO|nr:SDR family oxidoreductase [Ruania alkalisoli]QOR70613.1 SDR family oxidoreductase [Ruania alkalisoli]